MALQLPIGFESITYPSPDAASSKEKEIEVFHQSGVGIYEGKTRCTLFDKGKVILTSFRIIWIDAMSTSKTIALPLDKIITFDEQSGFLSTSPKIILTINNYESDPQSSLQNRQSLSPSQAIASIPQVSEWTCPICSYLYSFASIIDGKIKCPECGVSSSASVKQISSQSSPPSWICTICDATNNEPNSTKCLVCGVVKANVCSRASVSPTLLLPHSPSSSSSHSNSNSNSPSSALSPSHGSLESTLTVEDFSPIPTSMLKLSFRSGGATKFAAHLKTVLERRAWTLLSSDRRHLASPPVQSHSAGLSSIMKKIDLHQQHTQSEMTVAFEDLNSLILKAAEMTRLAERISKQITTSPTLLGTKEASFIHDFFSSLGIASPITKELVGNGYHFELAKELARLLPNLISNPTQTSELKLPSFISLLDLYCVWNRARGAALISPQDLTKAIGILPSIHSPFITKKYGDGLVTITFASNDDAFILQKLEHVFEISSSDSCKPIVCLSAFDYSVMERISVAIAKEQLLMAEMKGTLCRDETIDGILFYPNRILYPINRNDQ